jgi:hypothetical protein
VQQLRWPVLALGVLSVVLWLASYSWLVGVTPPTQWISRELSPWLIAEIAAVATGAAALAGGLLLARGSTGAARRIPIVAAALGGFALVTTALSLAMPA